MLQTHLVDAHAGIEKLAITAYGDILPCGGIQISYGNIREVSLREAWEEMLRNPEFSKVRECCPLSEDLDFIERILKPIEKTGAQMPLPAKQVMGELINQSPTDRDADE